VARKGRAGRGPRVRLDLSHASICGAFGHLTKKRNVARHLTCDFAILSCLCMGWGGQGAAGGCGKGVEVKREGGVAALVITI